MPLRRRFVALLGLLLVVPLAGPAAPAAGASKGMFKVVCDFSHALTDDPIVYPRRPGASHRHEFFGATSTNAYTTQSTLTSGGTTCENLKDKSAYWAPTLYQNGRRIEPLVVQVYYRARNRTPSTIKNIPAGLRIIAGNHLATSPQSVEVSGWSCLLDPPNFQNTMPTCSGGQKLRNRIRFPECWNGRDLDSANHKSHMAYLVNGTCPSGYPVVLPTVDIEVHYGLVHGGTISLASGSWTSLHGDFWNAWDSATLNGFIKTCLHTGKICDRV